MANLLASTVAKFGEEKRLYNIVSKSLFRFLDKTLLLYFPV